MDVRPTQETIYVDNGIYHTVVKMSQNTTSHMNTTTTTTANTYDYYWSSPSLDYTSEIEVPFNLLNVTGDMPFEYAVVMFGYIMPFLLVVTLVANILIVLVLAQKHMQTPTNIVLLVMAIADMLTLLFPAPWYFYMYTLNNHWKLLHPTYACYAYYYMIEVIPAFFHTASIWFTLLLAGQRYIYICHPCLARTWCTTPRVIRAIITIFLLAFLHQITRFFDRQYVLVTFQLNNKPQTGCQILSSEWVQDIEDFYYTSYYMFRIIFVHIGPCAALVVFNVLLFIALRKAENNRNKLMSNNCQQNASQTQENQRKIRDSNSTTIMLIVVVSVFLVVEIPLAITTLFHVMQNALDIEIVGYKVLNTTIVFSNFFIILSYPVNFAIYCGMSRLFRETFRDLLHLGATESGQSWSTRYTTYVNGDGVTKLVAGSRRYSVATNGLNSIITNNNCCKPSPIETML